MIERRITTQYFRSHILKWSKLHPSDYPWRKTDNLWHGLVAEIMLQRTKTDQVLPVFNDFVTRFPSPQNYLDHINEKDDNIFNKLGLLWRNESFKQTTIQIVEEGIPEYKKGLMNLPGIGDYVASAYISFHLNKRELLIDSNIVRLYGRYFGIITDAESRRDIALRSLADKITPKRNFKTYNYGVLDFAMNVCKPRPDCTNCVLIRKCYYKKEMN